MSVRISKGPHYIYAVIGTDGSFCGHPTWWRSHAIKVCPGGCRVECFRIVRTDVKKVEGRNNKAMARKT